MGSRKRIAVVGGGMSGITAVKSCLEEGLDPVCFELQDKCGGLWRYRDDDTEGLASVMWSTIINSSKEMSAFSDFPPPKDFPNYMHNTKMIRYLELYAEHFNVEAYIKFKHRIDKVDPSPDFDYTGRWVLTIHDLNEDKTYEDVFDGVMVCTGHHVYPQMVTFPGMNEFKGRIMHAHSYKKSTSFDGSRAVVVGVGNSGGDVAVDLSSVARQVYLSTRRGCWIIHRVGPNGKPFDAHYLRRVWNFLFHVAPYPLSCYLSEREVNQRFDHAIYSLKPQHRIHGQHPMVNDALPNRILSGTVIVKGNITRFTAKGVIFEDDDEECEADTVIFATGYEARFPYLDQKIVSVDKNKFQLYKYVIPPHLSHPTLSVIGLGQPVGPLFPISEIQSRWFALLMNNKVKLPPKELMLVDIKKKETAMAKRYFSGPRNTLQMDWIDYMDDIAKLIGVKPNLSRLLFSDPKLFLACVLGPCLPYQYRIDGPHPWPNARETILTYEDRLLAALKTRKAAACLPEQDQLQVNGKETSIARVLMACVMITMLAYICAIVL